MRKWIEIIARYAAFFYSARWAAKWRSVCDVFYTYRVCKEFRSVGRNPLIMRRIKVFGGKAIAIGDNFYCYGDQRFETYSEHNGKRFSPRLVIGHNVSINPGCHLACIERLELHDGVLLASRVFVTDHFHGDTSVESLAIPPQKRLLTTKGPVIIGQNAWLGEGVVVMPGVTIGRNAIIGANSVVTKNIPDNAVAAGVPARVIKQL